MSGIFDESINACSFRITELPKAISETVSSNVNVTCTSSVSSGTFSLTEWDSSHWSSWPLASSLCQNSISAIWIIKVILSYLLSQLWSLFYLSQLTRPKSFKQSHVPVSMKTSESTAATNNTVNTPSNIFHKANPSLHHIIGGLGDRPPVIFRRCP